ncbi:MAG: hypothetical protein IPO05_17575 [Flavobacteriales bacterium]|nr:hypothetical protein [Flavobacteriales bacterium]
MSPLTEADKRAHAPSTVGWPHRACRAERRRAGPCPGERQRWERYWLVDPLDGTKEFIKRNGEFTVNIALMERMTRRGPLGGARDPWPGAVCAGEGPCSISPGRAVARTGWKGRQPQAAMAAYERAAMSTLARCPTRTLHHPGQPLAP